MMRITPQMHEAISELVEQGKYSSLESFTETAVRNLLTLEMDNQPAKEMTENDVGYTLLHDNDLTSMPKTISAITLDDRRRNAPIWGLINRYAPAKMVLRELCANLISRNAEWIDLKEFMENTVPKAFKLRSVLAKRENATHFVRGESLQTGFPQRDARSQQRFADLYIGRFRSNKVTGLLGDLELASIQKDPTGNLQIGITKNGCDWASLKSPYLDDSSTSSDMLAFSEQERGFLLSHISRVRPGEFNFLNYLFKSVNEGNNTPEALTARVRTYANDNGWRNAEGEQISDAEVNTFKVGAVARLVEMRLLRIGKDGVRTTYSLALDADDLQSVAKLPQGGN